LLSQILLNDRRFNSKLPLKPGLSFSGGTLARDLNVLKKLGKETKRPLYLVNSILKSNNEHHRYVVNRIKRSLGQTKKPRISVFGLPYKAGTSTLRRSLPLEIVKELSNWGATIQAHDPKVDQREIPRIKKFTFHADPYEAMKHADALVFLTD